MGIGDIFGWQRLGEHVGAAFDQLGDHNFLYIVTHGQTAMVAACVNKLREKTSWLCKCISFLIFPPKVDAYIF